MNVRESSLGTFPCLVAGSGPPLVVLAGLAPEAGVSAGSLRRMHESAMRPWAREREVFYVNRRPGLPRAMTMAALAAEHARALREAFAVPVDLLGASTGGSIAQQLAAEHPEVVRRLALVSTGCRLGPYAKLVQRRMAARVRAGATRQAAAVMAGALAPAALRLPAACLGWLLAPRLFSERGLQDMATTIEAEDEFDLARLPTVRAPTLLVGGGRDRLYDRELFEQTAHLIPGCVLEIHPHRGHITVLSDPRAVAQVRGFLNHDKSWANGASPEWVDRWPALPRVRVTCVCFSPQADFVAGAAVAGVGVETLRCVRTRRELIVGALPLLFGLHQLVEGFVWLGLRGQVSHGLGDAAKEAYILYAHAVLPVIVPLGFMLLEPDQRRSRVMMAMACVGALLGAYLLWQVTAYPVGAHEQARCIDYTTHTPNDALIGLLYVAVTCGPALISSRRYLRWFGLVSLVGVIVTAVVRVDELTSLWCVYVAIVSVLILEHFRRQRAAQVHPISDPAWSS